MGEVRNIKEAVPFCAKLHQLYAAFAYEHKGGENRALKFNFVQESQLKRKLNAKCRELGLVLQELKCTLVASQVIPRGKPEEGKFTHLCTAHCSITLMNDVAEAVDPNNVAGARVQHVQLEAIGGGSDTSDKAPMKACVAAFKYALLNGLAVETGERESDEGGEAGEAPVPAERFEDLLALLRGVATGGLVSVPQLNQWKARCAVFREHPRFEELRNAFYALPGAGGVRQEGAP